MLKKNIQQIFEIFQSLNPNPQTELKFTNNYTLLVAVVLSAQSTDKAVNRATEKLFKVVDNPQKMLNLGENKLKKYISSIGLYNHKAKNIIELSKILIEKFNCQVPNDFEQLRSLPGVGRKTANVVLNCAFNIPTIAVDTHVFRLANRIGLVKEKTEEKTELKLLKVIPRQFLNHAHHWLILHGRYICTSRQAKCNQCKIVDFCQKNFAK